MSNPMVRPSQDGISGTVGALPLKLEKSKRNSCTTSYMHGLFFSKSTINYVIYPSLLGTIIHLSLISA